MVLRTRAFYVFTRYFLELLSVLLLSSYLYYLYSYIIYAVSSTFHLIRKILNFSRSLPVISGLGPL